VTETLHAIIGTAGHIDHGKTALVKALTGCDTDRLKEEKERGISIDLGFAALTIGDRRVGIIDVPGHERFIRNMLAGAHALDLVLFTVAADDGVMPQTEEHLDIVHLLGVERGVIALTKADLATADRLREVRDEVEILVAGTRLENAPIVPVSSTTSAGLADLLAEIDRQLATIERPPPPGRFRLPVDRAFVLKGHGVVVTGTALAGTIAVGAEVHVLPGGERARVRSVEMHGAPVAVAGWRQRVALNLVGLERTEIVRGHVIADPGVTLVSDRFDARVEIRPAARKGVASHARVRVHLGTAEALGKIVLLEGQGVLAPKRTAYAQLVLERPLVALRGDRFILRAENAQATLGGGEVVLPLAEPHRRRDATLVARLETVRSGALADAVVASVELATEFALPASAVAERLNVDEAEVRYTLDRAVEPAPAGAASGAVAARIAEAGARSGGTSVRLAQTAAGGATRRSAPTASGGAGGPGPLLLALPDGAASEVWTTMAKWERVCGAVAAIVTAFHTANPLVPGIEMEAVRAQLSQPIAAKLFRAMADRLAAEGVVVRSDSLLAAPGHRVTLAGGQEDVAAVVEAALSRAGYTPPDLKVLEAELGVPRRRLVDVLGVLEKRARVVRVASDLYYAADAVARARAALERHLQIHPEITAGEFRDCLDVSRKFSIALLDYFDRSGVTLRVGDARRLRRAAPHTQG
jgi:selenocysteine-specific elongation factor